MQITRILGLTVDSSFDGLKVADTAGASNALNKYEEGTNYTKCQELATNAMTLSSTPIQHIGSHYNVK